MASTRQTGATWGLGRISHRKAGSNIYGYDSSAGTGVCAYTIDTGVFAAHPEFQGRAKQIKSFTGVDTDDNGHGTHVAGIIGSKTYGVAKNVQIYAIKALNAAGSGSWSDIIAAIQYAVTDSTTRSCPKGVVVDMSLSGGFVQAGNDAVAAAVNAGLFFGVAAGNDGKNFNATSPASEPKAFAVGASDNTDNLAYFSNYGATLGAIAPGVDIISTWNDGKTVSKIKLYEKDDESLIWIEYCFRNVHGRSSCRWSCCLLALLGWKNLPGRSEIQNSEPSNCQCYQIWGYC
jgi:subtilisin family serine protease